MSEIESKKKSVVSLNKKDEPKITSKITPIINIDDKYIPFIKSGKKITSIRNGIRFYPKAVCLFEGKESSVKAKITNIYYKSFCKLTETDAKNDGFESLSLLKEELANIYPELEDEELNGSVTMTIIKFQYEE